MKGQETSRIEQLLGSRKPIIGMIHLNKTRDKDRLENAIDEIDLMERNGVNAVLVEDYSGTVDDAEAVLRYMHSSHQSIHYGVNILGSIEKSYELAERYNAAFVQIDSVCGHLPLEEDIEFSERLKSIRQHNRRIFLMGGVRFKYASVLSGRSLEDDLLIATNRCDAIVVTGDESGEVTGVEKIKQFRRIIADFSLVVGAGLHPGNIIEQLRIADAGIVGSFFKECGIAQRPMDEGRVRELMDTVAEIRKEQYGRISI